MKMEKRYVCPKCSWAIPEELRDRQHYTCPVCKNDFKVKWDKREDTFFLFHIPNQFRDEPLGLPSGSVRALIMILLSISCWFLILSDEQVPNYLLNLILIVIGCYFSVRTNYMGLTSFFNRLIEVEENPLSLPKGCIRGFIVLGFSISAAYLLIRDSFFDFGYVEFFFIFTGLIIGFMVNKLTSGYREDNRYIMLGHLKAFVVLLMTLSLFILIVSDSMDTIDSSLIRLISASIGFYFGSR